MWLSKTERHLFKDAWFTSPLVNKAFVHWNAYKQNWIDPFSVELSSFVEPSFNTLIVVRRHFDGKA